MAYGFLKDDSQDSFGTHTKQVLTSFVQCVSCISLQIATGIHVGSSSSGAEGCATHHGLLHAPVHDIAGWSALMLPLVCATAITEIGILGDTGRVPTQQAS